MHYTIETYSGDKYHYSNETNSALYLFDYLCESKKPATKFVDMDSYTQRELKETVKCPYFPFFGCKKTKVHKEVKRTLTNIETSLFSNGESYSKVKTTTYKF